MPFETNCLPSYHRAADQGSSVSYLGGTVALLAKGEDTGNRFALMSGEVRRGSEPPPHVHPWEDAFYYVLEGETKSHCGSDVYHVRAGEIVFLPHGKAHVFSCITPTARFLVQVQASGEQGVVSDRFLIDLASRSGRTKGQDSPDADAPVDAMSLAEDYGIRFLSHDEIKIALPHYESS